MIKRFLNKRTSLLLLCVSAALAPVLVQGIGNSPAGAASTLPATQGAVTYRQVVRVWVHGDNVYPDMIRVKPGRVLIVAENQRSAPISLALDRVSAGSAPRAITQVPAGTFDLRAGGEVTLEAGEYEYYELALPSHRGRLIVAP